MMYFVLGVKNTRQLLMFETGCHFLSEAQQPTIARSSYLTFDTLHTQI